MSDTPDSRLQTCDAWSSNAESLTGRDALIFHDIDGIRCDSLGSALPLASARRGAGVI